MVPKIAESALGTVMVSRKEERPRKLLFEATDVSFTYGEGKNQVVALDGFSMRLWAGEFISVVGPSGCGKSTLLRIMGRLAPCPPGVTKPIEDAKRREGRISVMFQSPVLMPWRNVLKNVLLPAELSPNQVRDWDAIRRWAEELLRRTGISDFSENYPFELSGGMQQRVALARALVLNPELMLLDEPFGALDALTRENMIFQLQDLWIESGITVLLITHDIGEAILLSDRVIVMSARPGSAIAEVEISLPRPRTPESRYHPEFLSAHQKIHSTLAGKRKHRTLDWGGRMRLNG